MESAKEDGKKLKFVFIGAGWVGGLTSAVLSELWPSHDFYVYDISIEQINKWNQKKIPFYEEGLEEIISKSLGKNLFFTNNQSEAFSDGDFFIICVHTPTKTKGVGKGEIHDLKYVESCARDIAQFHSHFQMEKPIAIVEKSTVGPGTCDLVKDIFISSQSNYPMNKSKFAVISNPEFLAEGVAVRDLKFPDRIIIGSDEDELSLEKRNQLCEIYSRVASSEKIITTKTYASELSKLASNAFLAQRISSINSLTPICENLNIDIKEISKCIGSDSRIGSKYLNASIGFGGSCLEKDLLALVYIARRMGLDEVASYWRSVVDINEYQKRRFVVKIVDDYHGYMDGKRVSFFGVAFKKNTCDCRGSAALTIAKFLLEEGAIIQVFDPQAKKDHFIKEFKSSFPEFCFQQEDLEQRILFFEDPIAAANNSQSIMVLTEWDVLKELNLPLLFQTCSKPATIYDCRGILDKSKVIGAGFALKILGEGFFAPKNN